ncbi:DinB family protein [Hyphomicrobium sp. 99]|uniref:DinB family protein n=1 Tax=Hyphomicrobium sp. 99 TaxID=1163419 RepID=UPI0005F87B87|nr:DinB family protein [Hyphomicrobium sp. 99]
MISPSYVRTLARYNSWQNTNLYGASESLSDAQRKEDRGAFFGSIHATLNHLLWADQTWMNRFGAAPPPGKRSIAEGVSLFEAWDELREERRRFDRVIQDWADNLEPSALEGELTWVSGATGRELTRPRALLIAHLFNHQTHHRGQVHALLTGFGIKPGMTDMPFGENIYAG